MCPFSTICPMFDDGSDVESAIEQQFVVVSLLKELVDNGMAVSIGSESGVAPLADCSLVVAPYEAGGEPAGAIAVLGPTRMEYARTMAAIEFMQKHMEQILKKYQR